MIDIKYNFKHNDKTVKIVDIEARTHRIARVAAPVQIAVGHERLKEALRASIGHRVDVAHASMVTRTMIVSVNMCVDETQQKLFKKITNDDDNDDDIGGSAPVRIAAVGVHIERESDLVTRARGAIVHAVCSMDSNVASERAIDKKGGRGGREKIISK